jgi:hypothetical protein
MQLLLFGTSGCHLCEQAEAIIDEYRRTDKELKIHIIDIAEQELWQYLYAVRIPVLHDPETLTDISWPFDLAAVEKFITGLKND